MRNIRKLSLRVAKSDFDRNFVRSYTVSAFKRRFVRYGHIVREFSNRFRRALSTLDYFGECCSVNKSVQSSDSVVAGVISASSYQFDCLHGFTSACTESVSLRINGDLLQFVSQLLQRITSVLQLTQVTVNLCLVLFVIARRLL